MHDRTSHSTAVALPTVGVYIAAMALWLVSTSLSAVGLLSLPLGIFCNAVAAYTIYIVIHDAAHGSVTSNPRIGNWLARLAVPMITPFISFRAFRYIHLAHHAATNEPGRDPDMWVASGGWSCIPRMAVIDLGYYIFYLGRVASRPTFEKVELVVSCVLGGAVLTAFAAAGYWREVLLLWLLPGRISIFFLALVLDYLPHHPHNITQRENPYRATKIRVGWENLISPLMLFQNYHLTHHLFPKLPFYKCVSAWRREESIHLARDPIIVTVGGTPVAPAEQLRASVIASPPSSVPRGDPAIDVN